MFQLIIPGLLILTKLVYGSPVDILSIEKRATSGPLYYSTTGHPACGDITERQGGTVWFDAAMCALVKGNPAWLSSKIATAPGADLGNLDKATFTIYDSSLVAHPVDVAYVDAIGNDQDNTDDTRAWWVGGFQRATKHVAPQWPYTDGQLYGIRDNEFTGGQPFMGLEILMGLPAGYNDYLQDTNSWNSDIAWGLVQKADYTPICIGTKTPTSKLDKTIAYTVMTTGAPADGAKHGTITLWNPTNGQITTEKFDDVFDDIFSAEYLVNFDVWTG